MLLYELKSYTEPKTNFVKYEAPIACQSFRLVNIYLVSTARSGSVKSKTTDGTLMLPRYLSVVI